MRDDLYPPLPADEAKRRFDELRRKLAETPAPAPIAGKRAGNPGGRSVSRHVMLGVSGTEVADAVRRWAVNAKS